VSNSEASQKPINGTMTAFRVFSLLLFSMRMNNCQAGIINGFGLDCGAEKGEL
jgi:hypothetical protein